MENKDRKSYKWLTPYLVVLGIAVVVLIVVVAFVRPISKRNKNNPTESAAEETQKSTDSTKNGQTENESKTESAKDVTESGKEDETSEVTEKSETESKKESEAGSSENTKTETEAPTEEETEFAKVAALDIAKIEKLVDRYYTAKINNNADELNSIVDTEKPYDVARLSEETQFIYKYDNFTIIVLPGISDKYFIAYVKYDIYFNGIATGAAALNHFIIEKDTDDSYCIYDRGLSGEFKAYLEETENSKKITQIKNQVEKELEEACQKDADLRYLIEMLKESN